MDLSYLDALPVKYGRPPTQTKVDKLPLHDLTWENFERLCWRLAKREDAHCSRYGIEGQGQQGIDIVGGDTKTYYQCKRVKEYRAADIKAAVEKFVKGKFKDDAVRFVLCCSRELRETGLLDEIKRQRDLLGGLKIRFDVWDELEISEMLRSEHGLVEQFFGSEWVKAFCTGIRKPDFVKARERLSGVYTTFDFSGIGVVQEGGPQSRIENVKFEDAYYEIRFRARDKKAKPIQAIDILKGERLRIIRGRGGSGKTTWLRQTFNRLLREEGAFPLMIELRALARHWEKHKSLDWYLQFWLNSHSIDACVLDSLKHDASAPVPVLLVDGWDELGYLGSDLHGKLLGLITECQRVRVVVTSRPYGDSPPRFELYEVEALNREDIGAFSERFYSACYPGDAPKALAFHQGFQGALDRSQHAEDLGAVPLLLVMMLMLSRVEPLPDRRHILYERCIANQRNPTNAGGRRRPVACGRVASTRHRDSSAGSAGACVPHEICSKAAFVTPRPVERGTRIPCGN